MADTNTTIDPAQANQSSATASADSQSAAIPAGLVEKHRLDSAMQKIQELTLANRTLAEQNATHLTASGQLRVQLANQEASIATTASEHTKLVGEYQTRETGYKNASVASEQLQRKLNAIKAVGRPELLSILDVLPSAETDELQIIAIQSIADFAATQAKARETQLTAGTTHTEVTTPVAAAAPTSDEGWSKHLDQFPLGSEERGKAMDQWFTYLNTPK